MTAANPNDREIKDALCEATCTRIRVNRAGEAWTVDTPHVLQDGHLLQVFVERCGNGWLVHDGGFATAEAEAYLKSPAAVRSRHKQLDAIGTTLGIGRVRGRFEYSAGSLDEALQRVAVMALAVDRALALEGPRFTESPWAESKATLARELGRRDLTVFQDRRIRLEHGVVKVDFVVAPPDDRRRAVIEFLAGSRPETATTAVDRAVVNLRLLAHAGYDASLFGVYDEVSPAADPRLQERFRDSVGTEVQLLPSREAPDAIRELLLAS